jgi:sigma-B regulation protein RsbU (phosphoserine phosphatase)
MLALVLVNNLTRSVNRLTGALSRVAGGDFSARVTVRSNDVIGYAGEVVNEMTEGLAERERLRAALQVAQEVQLNLLPRRPPKMAGLDLAGASLYCDETGGDYFDFLQPSADEMSVLVGDVSGHGVPAALLMTTARGFLRQRAALGGDPVHIVTDVNAALCRDVGESGRFMTLFYAAFDGEARRMTLVNAGHEPALLYDPEDDAFQHVGGRGLALGVIPGYGYRDRRLKMKPGQILVLATDGVWETTNAAGRPFGRDRLKALIRENRDRPAEEAVRAVIEAVEAFREGLPRHDDVTLVLIKAEADGTKGRPS